MPASRALGFVDRAALEAVLQPLVPDAADRVFVARCLVGEGPIHHRGANYVLIALLAQLAQRLPPVAGEPVGAGVQAGVRVPMRLPPHLADQVEDGHFPLQLPTTALSALAAGDPTTLHAMIDCLTDGPPQHVLANVVMVALIERLLAATTGR